MRINKPSRQGISPSRWVYAIIAAVFIIMMLPDMVIQPAKDSRVLAELMQTHADPGTRHLESSYPHLALHLSDYLFGAKDQPQVQVSGPGLDEPAFSEQELQHLKDVRSLFRLFQWLRRIGLVLLFALGILIVAGGKGNGRSRLLPLVSVWQRGVLLAVFFILVLAALVAINFHQAFYLMHRVLFTNDLWLLNPQTDLLIQLMPGKFFVAYAKMAGLRLGIILLGALAALTIIKKVLQGREATDA